MYVLKREDLEDKSIAYFLAPDHDQSNIEIKAVENEVEIFLKGSDLWEADQSKITTALPIKNVLAHVEKGVLKVEIQYDIPKKKSIKVTIN